MSIHAKLGAAALLGLLNIYCDGMALECDEAPAESIEIAAAQPPEAAAERSPEPATPLGSLVATWSGQTQRLTVDLKPPADTDVSQAWLFAGEIDIEQYADRMPPLFSPPRDDVSVKSVLHGGRDATGPLVFKDVEPGTYTVCGQFGTRGDDWHWAPLRCAHVTVADEVETRAVQLPA